MSIGPRWKGLYLAASETRFQKVSSAARAPVAPPSAKPLASTAAFMAPAEVPEMPSIVSQSSSSRRSTTPQVKAPCEPPPWKARSTSTGSRAPAAAAGVFAMVSLSYGRLACATGRVPCAEPETGHRDPEGRMRRHEYCSAA